MSVKFTVKEADPDAVGVPSITIVPAEASVLISPLVRPVPPALKPLTVKVV